MSGKNWRKLRGWIHTDGAFASLLVVGGVVAAGLVGTAVYLLTPAGGVDVPDWTLVFPVALLLFSIYGANRSTKRNRRDSLGASRARLANAEQALEDVLRRQRAESYDRYRRPPKPPLGDPTDANDIWSPTVQQNAERSGEGRVYQASRETRLSMADLALPELWATTHARLDHYHEIATGQAERSFRNAQVASGVGFIFLIGFAVLALMASTTAGSIVAGGLGAVAAALAGFVSRTFVRSQEAAASHLRSYFDQPLELSRFLAAERLVADAEHLSDSQRAEVFTAVAQAMVAGPTQPPQDSIPPQRGS